MADLLVALDCFPIVVAADNYHLAARARAVLAGRIRGKLEGCIARCSSEVRLHYSAADVDSQKGAQCDDDQHEYDRVKEDGCVL